MGEITMGANLKGNSGIKGLLLLHGEKIAIAVVGLLALWFVYSSWNLPRLESKYQASELQKQISHTTAEVRDFNWDTAIKDHVDKVRIFEPIPKSASMKVKADDYPIERGFDPAVIAATALRTDPVLRNAVDVRATGGSGLFAFVDDETRRKQELKQKTEAEELKKQQEKEIQQQQVPEVGRRPSRRNRQSEPELIEVDPQHPNRRLIEGGEAHPAGIPLQGGERLERAYWATVVAKVPIREQLKLYQDAFENARGYDQTRDFPQYLGYLMQRSEVVRGKPLEWKPVPWFDGQRKSIVANKWIHPIAVTVDWFEKFNEATKDWAGQAVEPVDSRYTDPVLTLPLPPLAGRDWGAAATHPDIPLAAFAPPLEEETEMLAEQPVYQPAETEDQLTIRGADTTQNLGAGAGRFGAPGGRGFGEEFRPSFGSREFGRGGGLGAERLGGPGGYAGGIPLAGQRTTLPRGVEFVLLRFFDYTVEPGKKYKYRVKLLLADPNIGLPQGMLDPAVQDRQAKEVQAANAKNINRPIFRVTENWSDPSPAVGIPLDGIVRLAEATLPAEKLYNVEPTVTMWVEKFDIDPKQDMAVHVAKEKVFHRGGVANLHEKMSYTGDGDRWRDIYDSYKLHTGYTVLDIEGADRLGKDLTAPARILLMDAAGELTIRNELDDSAAVQDLRFLFTEDKRRRSEGAIQGGLESFGGRPGRGF